MAGKSEVFRDRKGEYRFRLKASNGETSLASEGYKAKRSCLNGIASVQKNSSSEARYSRRDAKNGKPYFVLRAGNNQVIGNSEMYESESSRDNGIASVMKHGPLAVVEEQSA